MPHTVSRDFFRVFRLVRGQTFGLFRHIMRIHPFQGLVPTPAHAAEVACVPYDVVNGAEAADGAGAVNPW